jgi:hypothetical protein
MTHRYFVGAKKLSGTIELGDRAEKANVQYQGQSREAPGEQAGSAFWGAMRAAGVTTEQVNGFVIQEGSADGLHVAHVLPVLEGARAVYMILYRADKDASVFRSLGTRQRVGDALDVVFQKLKSEIILPHKP